MIYNNKSFRYLDSYNLKYPKNNKTREFYDSFNIDRENTLKFKVLDHDNKISFICVYNKHIFKNPFDNSSDQKGGGLPLYNLLGTALNIAKTGQDMYDAYGSKKATQIKNFYGNYINPSDNYRPGFPGEHHLISPDGIMYNYAGPGTSLIKRLRRKDPPVDLIDKAAKKHDIDYAKAKNISEIDLADSKFIKKISDIKGLNPTKNIVKYGMKGKQFAHKLGLPKNSFVGRSIMQDGKNLKFKNKDLKKLDEINQLGYGNKANSTHAKKLTSLLNKDPLSRLKHKLTY